MKKLFITLAFILFAASGLSAQSSERLSQMIHSEELTCGQAAYLAATYQNLVSEDATDEEAFKALADSGLFFTKTAASDKVTLSQVCHIYAMTTGLKGGLFYRLFHSKRYSFKEIKAIGIIPPEADPSAKVSGRDAIAIFNGCIDEIGGTE